MPWLRDRRRNGLNWAWHAIPIPNRLNQAAEAYRKAVEAAPDWVEARINLGTTLYQLGRMEECAGAVYQGGGA